MIEAYIVRFIDMASDTLGFDEDSRSHEIHEQLKRNRYKGYQVGRDHLLGEYKG